LGVVVCEVAREIKINKTVKRKDNGIERFILFFEMESDSESYFRVLNL
jgi:hypothetical protein